MSCAARQSGRSISATSPSHGTTHGDGIPSRPTPAANIRGSIAPPSVSMLAASPPMPMAIITSAPPCRDPTAARRAPMRTSRSPRSWALPPTPTLTATRSRSLHAATARRSWVKATPGGSSPRCRPHGTCAARPSSPMPHGSPPSRYVPDTDARATSAAYPPIPPKPTTGRREWCP